jgi:hypothetical protein
MEWWIQSIKGCKETNTRSTLANYTNLRVQRLHKTEIWGQKPKDIAEITQNTDALFDTTNRLQQLHHKINSERLEATNTMQHKGINKTGKDHLKRTDRDYIPQMTFCPWSRWWWHSQKNDRTTNSTKFMMITTPYKHSTIMSSSYKCVMLQYTAKIISTQQPIPNTSFKIITRLDFHCFHQI